MHSSKTIILLSKDMVGILVLNLDFLGGLVLDKEAILFFNIRSSKGIKIGRQDLIVRFEHLRQKSNELTNQLSHGLKEPYFSECLSHNSSKISWWSNANLSGVAKTSPRSYQAAERASSCAVGTADGSTSTR